MHHLPSEVTDPRSCRVDVRHVKVGEPGRRRTGLANGLGQLRDATERRPVVGPHGVRFAPPSHGGVPEAKTSSFC